MLVTYLLLWSTIFGKQEEKNTECLLLGYVGIFLDDLSVVSGHIQFGGVLVNFYYQVVTKFSVLKAVLLEGTHDGKTSAVFSSSSSSVLMIKGLGHSIFYKDLFLPESARAMAKS